MFKGFRVYLRALELDDYKNSIKWRRDDEIWDMVVGPKYYVSEAYENKWVEDAIFKVSNKLALAICMKETNKHIGYIYFTNIDNKNLSASFGYINWRKRILGKGISKGSNYAYAIPWILCIRTRKD